MHLTVQQISASLDGALTGVSLELVVRHLSSCHECRDRHSRLTKQDDSLRRLLACEFPEVFFDDMFARLTSVLEAESRGQMPPEHSRPPELPPLAPERPASRQMHKPKSVEIRNPALPSEEEQKQRVAEELKAAEAAALSSLEQLMRDVKEAKKEVAASPAEPAATATPPPAAPAEKLALPPSLMSLSADVLASLRQVGKTPPAPEPAAEPVADEPPVAEPVADEPEPIHVPEPEPVRAAEPEPEVELVAEASDEPEMGVDNALSWVEVDGPLPVDHGLEGEIEDFSPRKREPAAEPEPIHVPEPEPEPVRAAEPEPVRRPEPEPIHVPEPEPEPVRAAEPEPVRRPEPKPVSKPKPEPARAAEPRRTPEPVRAPAPEPVRVPSFDALPAPEPRRERAPEPSQPKRRVASTPNPVDDPYADYEERLENEPPGHSRYIPPRRPRKRHVGMAVAAVLVIAIALGSLGYLPAVIRVPVPELPKPHIPRIEVVKVPIAPAKPAARKPGASTAASKPSTVTPQTRTATQDDPGPQVVHAPKVAPVEAPVEEPARVAVVEPTPPPKPAPKPVVAKPVPKPESNPPITPTGPSQIVTTRTVTTITDHREPQSKPAPSKSAEPADDEGASWPLLCGVVLDDAGAPVAGARVALADLDLSARTDRRGRFCVAAPPGDRTLSVVAQGFSTHRRIVSLGASGLDVSITLPAAH